MIERPTDDPLKMDVVLSFATDVTSALAGPERHTFDPPLHLAAGAYVFHFGQDGRLDSVVDAQGHDWWRREPEAPVVTAAQQWRERSAEIRASDEYRALVEAEG